MMVRADHNSNTTRDNEDTFMRCRFDQSCDWCFSGSRYAPEERSMVLRKHGKDLDVVTVPCTFD